MRVLSCLSLLLVALVGTVLATADWHRFKAKHGKVYENLLDEQMRHSIFMKNKLKIDRFNELESKEAGFELGLNHLSDWTREEYKKMLGFRLPEDHMLNRVNSPEAEAFLASILGNRSMPLPTAVDWRKVPGRVTPVKNQGQCGSCWAFSTTGVLEGQELKTTKGRKLIPLSEQDLLDCDDSDNGCDGGLPSNALQKIAEKGGIMDEASYPYRASANKTCKFNKSKAVMTDKGYVTLKHGDEEFLKLVVATFGPVSVAIDASAESFHHYKSGVYHSKECANDPGSLDHAVLVVGYGTASSDDHYWIVKNSWGADWGEDGYIKMARNRRNMCGIATEAVIPVLPY